MDRLLHSLASRGPFQWPSWLRFLKSNNNNEPNISPSDFCTRLYWPGKFVPFAGLEGSQAANSVVTYHKLCTKCQGINSWLGKLTADNVESITDNLIPHYDTGLELEISARQNCHLCALFWMASVYTGAGWRFGKTSSGKSLYIDAAEPWQISLKTVRGARELKAYIHYELPVSPQWWQTVRVTLMAGLLDLNKFTPWPENLLAAHEPTDKERREAYELSCLATLGFCHGRKDPQWHRNLAIPVATASDTSRKWSKERLRHCVANHPKCKPSDPGLLFLPTRLIDVGSASDFSDLRLVPDTNGINERYLTLSYCWGKIDDSYKLKKDNFDSYVRKISFFGLPKTIQDALTITRWFDVRYIWVDALCIVQDDGADWSREAFEMYKIYQHSFLTIGALYARNAAEGCFALRDSRALQPCYLAELENGSCVFAEDYAKHARLLAKSFGQSRLFSRAWVYQERFLSRRALYFGDVLFWECCEELSAETSAYGFDPNEKWENYDINSLKPQYQFLRDVRLPQDVLTCPEIAEEGNDLNVLVAKFLVNWEIIVRKYTDICYEGLSRQTDRYAAIAGVIQNISECTGFENVAGLWRPFLLRELLWEADKLNHLPMNGIAPSWSWLSVDFIPHYRLIDPRETSRHLDWLAEVAEVKVWPVYSEQSGRETSLRGKLYLVCASIHLELHRFEKDMPENFWTYKGGSWCELTPEDIVAPQMPPIYQYCRLSLDRTPTRPLELLFLPIVRRVNNWPSPSEHFENGCFSYLGLLVEPVEELLGKGYYQRIGLAHFIFKSEGAASMAQIDRTQVVLV